MNVPRRIREILERKQDLIDRSTEKLNGSIIRLQAKLMDMIIDEIIGELEVVDGIIQDTPGNYQLIASMDKVFRSFEAEQARILLLQLNPSLDNLTEITNKYFLIAGPQVTAKRFDKVIEAARKITDVRFGMKGGLFVRGGVIESIIKDYGSTEVKQIMSRAITSGMNKRDFLKQMRGFVTGTEEKPGISERKWKQFSYDIYQQHDRAYTKKMMEEFDMKYFIYTGGLIKDSRDFCAAHNNKVWSLEEAEDWDKWTPAMGKYPEGYKVKAKDVNNHPSYMDYPGYDPMVDMGGYNCRHQIGPIMDELAFMLRPELKKET